MYISVLKYALCSSLYFCFFLSEILPFFIFYSFVLNMFMIVHWRIYMVTALKSLSDNCNICVTRVLASADFLLSFKPRFFHLWWVIFSCILSISLLYYKTLHLISICHYNRHLSLCHHSTSSLPGRGWKSQFPTLLSFERKRVALFPWWGLGLQTPSKPPLERGLHYFTILVIYHVYFKTHKAC